MLEELDSALQVASKSKELFAITTDMVWDQLQLAGQCDVYLRFGFQGFGTSFRFSFQ